MEPYGCIRRVAAWVETKRFWNIHQNWKYFAAPVTGVVAGIIRMMWSGQKALLDSILTAVVWALCFYVVAWVGSFLINYVWFTPADLYSKQHAEISRLIAEHEAARREFIAANETTKRELSIEREKNGRPDIRGEAFSFVTTFHGESYLENKLTSCHATIQFQLSLCNHRPVLTNLKGVEMDGTEMKVPAQLSRDALADSRDRILPQLPFGLETLVAWSTEMTVPGRALAEIHDLDLAGLKVYVVDGFGTRHLIQLRSGEMLFFR